ISITVLCKDRRKVPGEAAFWRIFHLYALHIMVIEHVNTKTKARGLFFSNKITGLIKILTELPLF
ncbi:hypothetical protein, partial [Sutterella wadsworthensis]|uniref:hypothetical protein n=1 Tax=Sutterella wadsworthensis TaxID=40545 RepID=UPI003A911EFE